MELFSKSALLPPGFSFEKVGFEKLSTFSFGMHYLKLNIFLLHGAVAHKCEHIKEVIEN
jgi:hypothetical protein